MHLRFRMSKSETLLKFLILPLLVCCFGFAFGPFDNLHFAVIGDMGCGCLAQEAIAEEMLEWHNKYPFRFVLTTGDNIYGDSFGRFWNRRRGGDKALFYERFDRYFNPLRKRGVLFFASLGNHDFETRQGRDLIEDRSRFNILSKTGYYYFSPNPDLVTFVALNTENILVQNANPSQLKWLQKVLSESKSKWKIVYGHHSIYTPPGYHPADLSLRKALEPIFVKNGVQVYLAGHNHFYARMKPQRGITHFTTGGGGRHLKTPRRTSETDVVARAHHFMHFELREDKLNYWAIPIQGAFLDRGTIRISVQ
jgi:hypothetical protein